MRALRDYDRKITLTASKRATAYVAGFWLLAIGADATAIISASVTAGAGYHAVAYGTLGALGDYARLGAVTAWLFVVLNVLERFAR